MDKKTQLILEAAKRWNDGEKVECLPGEVKWTGTTRAVSDSYYAFNFRGEDKINHTQFHYNEEEDTLTNWGRGLGLIYKKGVWAKSNKIAEELQLDTYQIY